MNRSQQSKGHQLVPIVKSSGFFLNWRRMTVSSSKPASSFVSDIGRRHFENNAD
jgi:hypothetical protein